MRDNYRIVQVEQNKYKIQRETIKKKIFSEVKVWVDLGRYYLRYFEISYYDSEQEARDKIKDFNFKEKIIEV